MDVSKMSFGQRYLLSPLEIRPKTCGQISKFVIALFALIATLGLAQVLCARSSKKQVPSITIIKTDQPSGEIVRDKDSLGGTRLHIAAKKNVRAEWIAKLSREGVDFDAVDGHHNTALMWAIANANNTIALEILKYPQNYDYINPHYGNAAIHLIVAKGYREQDSEGRYLLTSNLQLARALFTRGADPDLRTKNGLTPLHIAYLCHDLEMIEVLREALCDESLRTTDGLCCQQLWDMDDESAGARLIKICSLDNTNFMQLRSLSTLPPDLRSLKPAYP